MMKERKMMNEDPLAELMRQRIKPEDSPGQNDALPLKKEVSAFPTARPSRRNRMQEFNDGNQGPSDGSLNPEIPMTRVTFPIPQIWKDAIDSKAYWDRREIQSVLQEAIEVYVKANKTKPKPKKTSRDGQ